jgi:hypothetical protein
MIIKSLSLTLHPASAQNAPMARPLRMNYPGAFYHVTCRGKERKNVFANDRDRSLFLDRLGTSIGIYQVQVHAYVLAYGGLVS